MVVQEEKWGSRDSLSIGAAKPQEGRRGDSVGARNPPTAPALLDKPAVTHAAAENEKYTSPKRKF